MAVTTLPRDANSDLQRQVMIDSQLRPSDVTDPRVLSAIAQVDRLRFVPAARAAMAYADRAIPLADGRSLNPVLTTARLIVELAPEPGSSVLLIGAATGYGAAILAAMGANVTAVESDPSLAEMARMTLADVGNLTFVEAPFGKGVAAENLFDALMFDGHVEQVPAVLLRQLRDGARIVGGISDGAVTRIGRAVRVAGIDSITLLPFADIECVPLPGFAAPRHFQF